MLKLTRARTLAIAIVVCIGLIGNVTVTTTAQSDAVKKPRKGYTLDELPPAERDLSNEFILFSAEKSPTIKQSTWFGIPTRQHPFDLWIIQEILSEVNPDIIVETGTKEGGSAVIWAMILEQLNPRGRVITIDAEDRRSTTTKELPLAVSRVKFLLGSSTSAKIVDQVKRFVAGKKIVLILNAHQSKAEVLKELRTYWPLVNPGSYIIVQNSAINGHPIAPGAGPGPWEAIEAFVEENRRFTIDKNRERFLLTNNPNGFLKRVR